MFNQCKKLQDKIKNYFINKYTQNWSHSWKSLGPTNNSEEYSLYIRHLKEAVECDDIQNIALSGNYGCGKSSILRSFKESRNKRGKNKIIQISFSSLGANMQGHIDGKSNSDDYDKVNDLTNLIQKEIVKQILFKEKVSNVPYSKYKRISRPRLLNIFLGGFLIPAITWFILYTNGQIDQLCHFLNATEFWQVIILSLCLIVVADLLIAIIVLKLHGKINIDKISASSLSLSLSKGNSYFDEYLDEIIYYFAARKYEVVIFEDIDRFESLYIFETLRQLNTTLNNSDQIKQHITFIYALRDSIFTEELESDDNIDKKKENQRKQTENRTKFFDLIIPVVPFLASTNSLDRILEVFDEKYREDIKAPASIVAKHITDMRLLKNIYNEFLFLRDRIILDNSLTLDKLFVMVVYKNYNLIDFEKIKDGNSLIDKIISVHSEYINERILYINHEISTKEDSLQSINSVAEKARGLGEVISGYIKDVMRQIKGGVPSSYFLNDYVYESENDLKSAEFWKKLVEDNSVNALTINYTLPYSYGAQTMVLDKNDISKICHDNLDKTQWDNEKKDSIKQEVRLLRDESKEIRYLSIKDLIKKSPEFSSSLEKIIEGDEMTWELVKAGFIDTDFVHYTLSYCDKSMSLKARSFLLNNIRWNRPNFSHEFDGDKDIKALLDKISSSYFGDQSMYNLSIVDYLLENDNERVDDIITSLINASDNALKFIDIYVKDGDRVDKFIQKLTAKWNKIFTYIANNEEMDNEKKGHLISLALVTSDSNIKYEINPQVNDFIKNNIANIQIFVNSKNEPDVDKSCRLLAEQFDVELRSFDNISHLAKEFVKKYNLYEINEPNMTFVLGNPREPLDIIRRENKQVYLHILKRLGSYIGLLQNRTDTEYTLAGEHGFESVINDVSKNSIDKLNEILNKVDKSKCIIQNINNISQSAWSLLLENTMVANTLSNILLYFELCKSNDEDEIIDNYLIEYLNKSGKILLDKEVDQYNKDSIEDFVIAVLNNTKINVNTSANIAKTCMKSHIDISKISPREGDLYGILLDRDCIDDTIFSFQNIRELSWRTKSSYIANSEKFLEYISDLELNGDEIHNIATDKSIQDNIKYYIIDNIEQYSQELSKDTANKLAEFALSKSKTISASSLEIIINEDNRETAIKLICLSMHKFNASEMQMLLSKVGGEYEKLVQPKKRPSFNETSYDLILVEGLVKRLKELGLVSKYKFNNRVGSREILVFMKDFKL